MFREDDSECETDLSICYADNIFAEEVLTKERVPIHQRRVNRTNVRCSGTESRFNRGQSEANNEVDDNHANTA